MINLFPYTDAHELNLDWVVEQVKANDTKVKDLTNTVINMHFDFDSKADKATTYTKTEVNTLLLGKANVSDIPDMSNYYDKTETDTLLASKADVSDLPDMTDYYDKTETDTLLNAKADTSSLATVATSGDYNDLSNRPDVPLFKIVAGNFAGSDGFSSNYSYPAGFDINNCSILSINVTTGTGQYRSGTGVNNTSFYRTFAQMDTGGIKAYNNDPNNYNAGFKILLINKS